MAEVPWGEEMAVMISADHAKRVKGVCEGEVLVFGEDDAARNFLAPRILPNAGWEDRAMKEEVFGPVLPVVGYGNEGELLEKLGEMEKPLAIYCFSRRDDFVEKVGRSLGSGSICVNDTMKQFAQLKLPLGGVGESGFGRYRGRFGVESLSYQRVVMKRYFTWKDFGEMMPPYDKMYRWVRRFLK